RFPNIGHPHNDYLRLWHDFGLLGVGLFALGLLILIVGAVRRALRTEPGSSAVHWSAALGLSAVAAAAATDNVFIYPFVMLPLAAVVGVSIGRRDHHLKPARGPALRRPPVVRVATAGAPREGT
ncbi:MAG TPA: hypothetical protein VGC94_10620, partial [Amnibacterium sp.]